MVMMMPAITTPEDTAIAVSLPPMCRKLAASVPVQAPVPGMLLGLAAVVLGLSACYGLGFADALTAGRTRHD